MDEKGVWVGEQAWVGMVWVVCIFESRDLKLGWRWPISNLPLLNTTPHIFVQEPPTDAFKRTKDLFLCASIIFSSLQSHPFIKANA